MRSPQGRKIDFAERSIVLTSDVPAKHKFVTEDLLPGADVLMYGVLVGKATHQIEEGSVVSTRNIGHDAMPYREKSTEHTWNPPDISRWRDRTFLGYRRTDGQVGTRNYWLVVPLVFCENRNIETLKQAFEEELGFAPPKVYRRQVAEMVELYQRRTTGRDRARQQSDDHPRIAAKPAIFKNVDGIKFLMHQSGCGGTREDGNNLCALIAGYLHHPNIAGATVLSLGCQNSQVSILREQVAARDPKFKKPLLVFEQQKSGSEFQMLSEAMRETFLGVAEADRTSRAPAPLSKLCVGLKCGGSDGFSGISANPAVGHLSDLIAALGRPHHSFGVS